MNEKGKIFTRSDNSKLESLQEAPFDAEADLQELVAEYPELLSGEQIDPNNPRRWIVVGREQGISDRVGAGNRWFVDHLLIDQDAVPTLVEAKRSSNPEIRRRIVGQMLDYAAHATGTWSIAEVRKAFESREPDPEGALSELLQSESEPDVDAFWADVATNLAAKRLRLLFVADRIPDELARVVEFLNEQMPNIEVLAVEIKRYSSEFNETLVPRVIGRLAGNRNRTDSGSRRLTKGQFLSEFDKDEVRDAARRLLDVASTPNASLYFGTRGVSIRAHCPIYGQPITVAWIYPPSRGSWMKVKDFSFGAGNGTGNGRLFGMELPDELEEHLKRWTDEFSEDAFVERASSAGVVAYSVKPEEAAKHICLLESRLEDVISRLANLKPLPSGGAPS